MTGRLFLLALALFLTACAPPTAPPPGMTERYSGTAIPRQDLREALMYRVHAYWAAIAADDWHGAYGFMTLDAQEKLPYSDWRAMPQRDWPVDPRITAIHWTRGHLRHEGPELYALIDWSATDGTRGTRGTLTWRFEPDGSIMLEGTEIRRP